MALTVPDVDNFGSEPFEFEVAGEPHPPAINRAGRIRKDIQSLRRFMPEDHPKTAYLESD